MNRNLKIALGLAGAVFLLSAGSCDNKITEPFNDAPRGRSVDGPADVIPMPDGFSNVAAKCDGPNRVYVVFKGDNTYGSVTVVKDDPRCVK